MADRAIDEVRISDDRFQRDGNEGEFDEHGVLPNTGTSGVKPVAHGGDLGEVRRRFPDAPLPWIDLSTGINPVPYPVPALPPESWTRLPSRADQGALIEAAARRYGVSDPETIVAAPGTQALIQLLPRLFPKSRVVVVGPTYEEHEVSWRRQGHDVSVVDHLPAQADVVVLVNPDNPTGRLLSTAALGAVKGLLVVDEAFIDFHPDTASLAGKNAVVLRSFGKTYGLAGLRLGFAIAERSLAARMREELGPWAVPGPAIEIGRRALSDDAWLRDTTQRVEADSKRLDALLAQNGFDVLGGTFLFRLTRHPDALRHIETLARHGIHVRRFAREPSWLRFGLPGNDAEFSRLARALSQ
jgi:cobalamin biosynthetic protein CobC